MTLALRRYFYSGWAFLIPYLAAYLLYYRFNWPVNPADAGVKVRMAGESGTWVPCLLHVYFGLHAINLVLVGIALVQFARSKIQCPSSESQGTKSEYPRELAKGARGLGFLRFPSFTISRFSGSFSTFLPWLLLALLFWIPGVYLEYPSDPWEHYRRINEWSAVQTISEHSEWTKSSYFLPYSLLGQIAPPTRQLFWLDFYYTGCCLLLCWQYYRFARAVGLGERASMLFVILQSVLFGNNIFGFYRYYGISSSIFAQLGAVALTRVAIEYASQKFQVPRPRSQGMELEEKIQGPRWKDQGARAKEQATSTKEQGASSKETFSAFARLCAPLRLKRFGQPASPLSSLPPVKSSHELAEGAEQRTNDLTTESQSYRASDGKIRDRSIRGPTSSTLLTPLPPVKWFGLFPSRFPLSAFASAALAAFALLALIVFNHQQGLGIAGLGLLAVAIWRLIEWKRSMIWWLTATALVLSIVAIRWFPRDPAIDQIYRPQGWLTAWYGFNLFAFKLPVGDRMLQIVGAIGLGNLVAAIFLLRRNSLVGWLTLTPLIGLSLPFIAIPFVNSLVKHAGVPDIITYQRMLFAIPPSLALIALLEGKFQAPRIKSQGNSAECSQEEVEKQPTSNFTTESQSHRVKRSDDIPVHQLRTGDQSKGESTSAPLLTPLYPEKQAPEENQIACGQASAVSRFPAFSLSRFSPRFSRFTNSQFRGFAVLLLALTALLLVPANDPNYNRFWHALMIPPDDLTMKPVVSALDSSQVRIHAVAQQTVAAPHAVAVILVSIAPMAFPYVERNIGQPIADPLNSAIATALLNHKTVALKDQALIDWYTGIRSDQFFVLIAPPTEILWSNASQAAQLSRHWPAQEVATDLAGSPELAALAHSAEDTSSRSGRMIIELDELTKAPGAASR
jgi:hypothetical protein